MIGSYVNRATRMNRYEGLSLHLVARPVHTKGCLKTPHLLLRAADGEDESLHFAVLRGQAEEARIGEVQYI